MLSSLHWHPVLSCIKISNITFVKHSLLLKPLLPTLKNGTMYSLTLSSLITPTVVIFVQTFKYIELPFILSVPKKV